MIRTRFAPSPTGYMHIGNLRTALYAYLISKHDDGKFILRIEDTDQERFTEGATEAIFRTLDITGIKMDEGPKSGGDFGPYIQTERRHLYLDFAKQLVENGNAYYCFCTKERLNELAEASEKNIASYDRHCLNLSKEEIEQNLKSGVPYVIRQKITDGDITFKDAVYGEITVTSDELDDQVLMKSDGLPTYNFANVVDDHLMQITHIIRGSEYLSSTPKYNLLYSAFGWDIPEYIHLPLLVNLDGNKLSKRRGDASFEDLIEEGYLPEAIVNYIALLGWSPSDNKEFFTLDELIKAFDIKNISKSPSTFDPAKLKWINTEYIKKMDDDKFHELALPYLEKSIERKDIDLKVLSSFLKSRVSFVHEVADLVDFIDVLDDYDIELFNHKKMKTNAENSLTSLQAILPELEKAEDYTVDALHTVVFDKIAELEIKNGIMLWPLRTALSGKPTSPCGGIDLLALLGKEESIKRIKIAIEKLS